MGTAEITINSRKLYKGSLTELLDIDPSKLGKNENIVGYLTVEMTDGTHHLPKVIGALTFQGGVAASGGTCESGSTPSSSKTTVPSAAISRSLPNLRSRESRPSAS